MVNSYQLAQVHTTIGHKGGGRRYDFLTEPIVGYQNALGVLMECRQGILGRKDLPQPSIIYRDQFTLGTEVFRLIKVDPKHEPYSVTAVLAL